MQIDENRAWAAWLSGDLANAVASADRAIELADELEGPERSGALRGALSARALAGTALGEDASDLLGHGIALEGLLTEGEVGTPRAMLGRIQTWMGDLEAARTSLHRELHRFLQQGHASGTWEIHTDLADLEFRAGRWARASSHAREAEEIAIETGWSTVLGQILPVKAAIAAATGEAEQARADAATALDDCLRMADRWNELKARATLGFLEITNGDPVAAHAWLAPAVRISAQMGLKEPGAVPFIPDAVEALIAVGDAEGASTLADRLAAEGAALGRPLALALADRCHGIVAVARREFTDADDHLQRALQAQASLGHPFESARTLLRRQASSTGACGGRSRPASCSIGHSLSSRASAPNRGRRKLFGGSAEWAADGLPRQTSPPPRSRLPFWSPRDGPIARWRQLSSSASTPWTPTFGASTGSSTFGPGPSSHASSETYEIT